MFVFLLKYGSGAGKELLELDEGYEKVFLFLFSVPNRPAAPAPKKKGSQGYFRELFTYFKKRKSSLLK